MVLIANRIPDEWFRQHHTVRSKEAPESSLPKSIPLPNGGALQVPSEAETSL